MTAQLTSLLTAGAKPKPSHSRSTSLLTAGAQAFSQQEHSAKQFVLLMPPVLRHSLVAIRGWLLFIYDSPRTSQVFSPQEPQLPKSSHSRSTQPCQFSCRPSTTGTSTSTAEIRGCLFNHAPLQFYTIVHRFYGPHLVFGQNLTLYDAYDIFLVSIFST